MCVCASVCLYTYIKDAIDKRAFVVTMLLVRVLAYCSVMVCEYCTLVSVLCLCRSVCHVYLRAWEFKCKVHKNIHHYY